MALTGMQIYKNLPKTNCKDCGLPTCMAFAMQVAAKQRALADCPHITDEASESLSEASAPPMKLVKIGASDKVFEIGQETVMFRHDEKFHRATGIAVRIPASLSDEEAAAKLDQMNKSSFIRVGAELKIGFCAIEVDNAPQRVKQFAEKSKIPIILIGSDEGAMKTAAESIKSDRPLLYKADAANIDGFAAIAASAKLPLAVGGKDLEQTAELAQKACDKGVEDIMLAFSASDLGETVRSLTIARRAALKKQFRPFGYPAIVEVISESAANEAICAGIFSAKYGGIVLIDGVEPWEILPVMTTAQDVYTDPQVPNTVETKLYEIGNPDENSPVLFTTNFSLTYFSVEGEVERSKVPAYISVVDTEGLGVLNAYAGDKISAEAVVKTLRQQSVADKVKHRKLIIPGLLPIFRAEIEDSSEWKEVIIGPEQAREIPAFLTSTWK